MYAIKEKSEIENFLVNDFLQSFKKLSSPSAKLLQLCPTL